MHRSACAPGRGHAPAVVIPRHDGQACRSLRGVAHWARRPRASGPRSGGNRPHIAVVAAGRVNLGGQEEAGTGRWHGGSRWASPASAGWWRVDGSGRGDEGCRTNAWREAPGAILRECGAGRGRGSKRLRWPARMPRPTVQEARPMPLPPLTPSWSPVRDRGLHGSPDLGRPAGRHVAEYGAARDRCGGLAVRAAARCRVLFYMVATVVAATRQRWPGWALLLGLLAAVPPLVTVPLEWWFRRRACCRRQPWAEAGRDRHTGFTATRAGCGSPRTRSPMAHAS